MANALLLLHTPSCSRFPALIFFWHFSYFIDDCSCVVQRENSRDLLSSCSSEASKAQMRHNRRSLTVSSIPEEVSSMPFDDRSGWILDPPLFIRTNSSPAPRSLGMDENRLVPWIEPSRAVPELSPAKAVHHDSPHDGTHCAKENHDKDAHTSAITDISLVQVWNPYLSLMHGSMSVYLSVPVVSFLVSCTLAHRNEFVPHPGRGTDKRIIHRGPGGTH
jgi:hypothetical protein